MASEQKRLFLALSLSALVLFTWQAYFAPKDNFDASINKTKSVDGTPVVSTAKEAGSEAVVASPAERVAVETLPVANNSEAKKVVLVNGENTLQVSSDFSISGFKSVLANDSFQDVVGARNPLQVFVIQNGEARRLTFDQFSANGSILSGFNEALGVTLSGSLDEKGIFNWSLGSDQPHQYFISSQSEKKEGEARQIRQFLTYFKEVDRNNIDDDETVDGKIQWFGIDFHYHLFATVFRNKLVAASNIKNQNLGIKLVEPTTKLAGYNIFTKKSYDDLSKQGSNLQLSVDFGVFGVIAVPILRGLQFFYKYVPNYGFAIILITLFIRTLLFPLQYKSFKSMKKMQRLQPDLAKVKEKYGDDPQRMQKETMELFKKNGANPMGGCLPLVLQMPVFFAFYQVLFNSVELLNAPFILWINDLSAKDPYYVLPVLMGAAMFAQTKLNPSTTADPTQQKMMMFMPLIFTFFMKDLPAGLNLYIFVSTVFGIAQQLFVYKTVD
ncbi:MAG: membrane protein insertase YidC [Bacteriovoracaceae bacterium]|nr:membrane protein insertase YidC [Bacteriovoracaceae bacterium]